MLYYCFRGLQILKNPLTENQSGGATAGAHEMWKNSTAESNWTGSTTVKLEPPLTPSAVTGELLHSGTHWSKTETETSASNAQTSSGHSFRLVTKPITNILIKPNNSQNPHGKCIFMDELGV